NSFRASALVWRGFNAGESFSLWALHKKCLSPHSGRMRLAQRFIAGDSDDCSFQSVKRTGEPKRTLKIQQWPFRSFVRFTDYARFMLLSQHWSAGLLAIVR